MNDESKTEDELQFAKTGTPSRKTMLLLIVGLIAFGGIMAMVGKNPQCGCSPFGARPGSHSGASDDSSRGRPRLLDLGASQCIPCKMMAPILDELKDAYLGRLDVEFIDVRQNPNAAAPYGVESIPTQIFFDAAGKEIYRHQGFIAKEDILKKWQELGIDLAN
jgi:thioredoxin 1